MKKLLGILVLGLFLSGNAYANFKLKKCKDVETNEVFSYEFFRDLEKVIIGIGEYNGQLFSYDEIKVKKYDYLDRNFIVFAETESYDILILEDEQIVIKIAKTDKKIKKEKC
tara:strand:- start:172 stop:507 length:336 start_codon:yes stop_codon:yes gene_type:complete